MKEENGLTEDNIICHSEGYRKGIASNHGDVMHWFPKHGKSMDTFRADVKAGLAEQKAEAEADMDDPEKTIWDFLYGKLGNAYGAAGVMGNLYAESGLRPNNLQNSFEKKFDMTDDDYIAAVDDGTYTEFTSDGAGVSNLCNS